MGDDEWSVRALRDFRTFILKGALDTSRHDDIENTRGDWPEKRDVSRVLIRSAVSGIDQSQDNPETCCHRRA